MHYIYWTLERKDQKGRWHAVASNARLSQLGVALDQSCLGLGNPLVASVLFGKSHPGRGYQDPPLLTLKLPKNASAYTKTLLTQPIPIKHAWDLPRCETPGCISLKRLVHLAKNGHSGKPSGNAPIADYARHVLDTLGRMCGFDDTFSQSPFYGTILTGFVTRDARMDKFNHVDLDSGHARMIAAQTQSTLLPLAPNTARVMAALGV